MTPKPIPPIAPWSKPYWDAANDHKLLIQYCPTCEKHIFYPRLVCPFCFNEEIVWVEASGKGKVYAFSVVQNNAPSPFIEDMPYVIAIVHLDEGVPMMTNIVGCEPESVHSEMPVEVTFEKLTDHITLPKFKPADIK